MKEILKDKYHDCGHRLRNTDKRKRTMKKPKPKYSEEKFQNLFFAVTQGENEEYRRMYNLMVDFGLSKRQIFTRFTEYLETYRREADMILNKL